VSGDPELCPGGDYSAYQCSLCERYVEPFSNDDGTLICPYCEATGLVILNEDALEHLAQAREFARMIGLSRQLEKQLDYLASYDGRQCVLGKGFAPHSFDCAIYRPGVKDARRFSFNGGLLFQRPGLPADGSWPVSSNGTENRRKPVIPRVFPGLRSRNQAVLPRFPPELDV